MNVRIRGSALKYLPTSRSCPPPPAARRCRQSSNAKAHTRCSARRLAAHPAPTGLSPTSQPTHMSAPSLPAQTPHKMATRCLGIQAVAGCCGTACGAASRAALARFRCDNSPLRANRVCSSNNTTPTTAAPTAYPPPLRSRHMSRPPRAIQIRSFVSSDRESTASCATKSITDRSQALLMAADSSSSLSASAGFTSGSCLQLCSCCTSLMRLATSSVRAALKYRDASRCVTMSGFAPCD